MKKFFLSAALMSIFGAYIAYNYFASSTNAQAITITNTPTTAPAFPIATTPAAPVQTTAPTPTTITPTPVVTKPTPVVAKGQYTNGTYTGSAANAYYGNIQVEATISGGKLTDVTFLQYPSDRSTSRYINEQAMPELRAEAIQAQSANVDGVSGASDSSAAFKESLGSALSQAQA